MIKIILDYQVRYLSKKYIVSKAFSSERFYRKSFKLYYKKEGTLRKSHLAFYIDPYLDYNLIEDDIDLKTIVNNLMDTL